MAINIKHKNLPQMYFAQQRSVIEQYGALNLSEGYTGIHCSEKLISLMQKHILEDRGVRGGDSFCQDSLKNNPAYNWNYQ